MEWVLTAPKPQKGGLGPPFLFFGRLRDAQAVPIAAVHRRQS